MIDTFKPEEQFNASQFIDGFMKGFVRGALCAIIVVSGLLYTAWYITPNMTTPKPEGCFIIKHERNDKLDQESVYQQILDYEILEPEIVLRQSILETGWYTSKNCIERNNCFGMKGGDKTNDNPNGYAIYSDWRESVLAYKLWQDRNYNPAYCGSYYDFLEYIGYATSPEYVEKLKGIKL